MTVICCVCQRQKIKGIWKQNTVKKGEMVSHGLCPDCLEDQHKVLFGDSHRQSLTFKEARS